MGKATQDLRKEHDAILHVLGIMDSMMSASQEQGAALLRHYSELLRFFRVFVDQCHHGKEENHLFKELVKAGVPNETGPVGVMLHEHSQGRRYIVQMNQSLEAEDPNGFETAATEYRDLLRNHIEKENNVLFVMADRMLDEGQQDGLFKKFEQHEEDVIGHGVHEELHAMIHRWSEEFEVH